ALGNMRRVGRIAPESLICYYILVANLEAAKKPSGSELFWLHVLETLEADHGSRQCCEAVQDCRAAVVADPHATQSFDPADRSLHDPANAAQMTSMCCIAVPNVRFDTKESEDVSRGLTVVSSVGIEFIGHGPRTPRLTTDLRKLTDCGKYLPMIARV